MTNVFLSTLSNLCWNFPSSNNVMGLNLTKKKSYANKINACSPLIIVQCALFYLIYSCKKNSRLHSINIIHHSVQIRGSVRCAFHKREKTAFHQNSKHSKNLKPTHKIARHDGSFNLIQKLQPTIHDS